MQLRQIRGLLLSHTVECAKTPDKVKAIHANHAAVRITVLQDLQGPVVCCVAKCWNHHATMGTIRYRIARSPETRYGVIGFRLARNV